ncbi:hypothetical protein [Dactylosporangium sp. CA-092794]|uniref:hypothetical protein n=1 Tax=Dactylosporangium sp. CA-092794 TaxID=3239929 RepID=UPI003D94326E
MDYTVIGVWQDDKPVVAVVVGRHEVYGGDEQTFPEGLWFLCVATTDIAEAEHLAARQALESASDPPTRGPPPDQAQPRQSAPAHPPRLDTGPVTLRRAPAPQASPREHGRAAGPAWHQPAAAHACQAAHASPDRGRRLHADHLHCPERTPQ